MMPISKAKLENLCVQYLNHQERSRPVNRIQLMRPRVGRANWSVAAVEPKFSFGEARASLALIREMQASFRMVTAC